MLFLSVWKAEFMFCCVYIEICLNRNMIHIYKQLYRPTKSALLKSTLHAHQNILNHICNITNCNMVLEWETYFCLHVYVKISISLFISSRIEEIIHDIRLSVFSGLNLFRTYYLWHLALETNVYMFNCLKENNNACPYVAILQKYCVRATE